MGMHKLVYFNVRLSSFHLFNVTVVTLNASATVNSHLDIFTWSVNVPTIRLLSSLIGSVDSCIAFEQ
jgi:hypothetical protein